MTDTAENKMPDEAPSPSDEQIVRDALSYAHENLCAVDGEDEITEQALAALNRMTTQAKPDVQAAIEALGEMWTVIQENVGVNPAWPHAIETILACLKQANGE